MAQNLLQVQLAKSCRKIHKLPRFEHRFAAGIGDPKRNGGDEKILVVAQRIVRNVPPSIRRRTFFFPRRWLLGRLCAEGRTDT